VYNPQLPFRLQELPQLEDWLLSWQNKQLNPQPLRYCPGLHGVLVSFPNLT